jgi:hypothetical protein
MPDLACFQADFAKALTSDQQPASPFRSQAFAVYRNTSARGAVEALRAAFPTVDMLVGDEMFTQVALDYRREQPPAGPVLSDYGKDFAGFLARQPWSSELPYLADVARLDRLWLDSFLARDAAATPRSVGGCSLIMLHPATRFAWLATPAMSIWQAHRDPCGFAELDPDWAEEGALFTRPGLAVRAELIDPAYYHLLQTCMAPAPVADVVSAVAAAFRHVDVPELLQSGVSSGALCIQ